MLAMSIISFLISLIIFAGLIYFWLWPKVYDRNMWRFYEFCKIWGNEGEWLSQPDNYINSEILWDLIKTKEPFKRVFHTKNFVTYIEFLERIEAKQLGVVNLWTTWRFMMEMRKLRKWENKQQPNKKMIKIIQDNSRWVIEARCGDVMHFNTKFGQVGFGALKEGKEPTIVNNKNESTKIITDADTMNNKKKNQK